MPSSSECTVCPGVIHTPPYCSLFHGLTREERAAMGREVSEVASDDATLLLDCFAPGRRGPLPRACTRADVEEAFPAWEITDAIIADSDPDLLARALRFDELFYRLRRR